MSEERIRRTLEIAASIEDGGFLTVGESSPDFGLDRDLHRRGAIRAKPQVVRHQQGVVRFVSLEIYGLTDFGRWYLAKLSGDAEYLEFARETSGMVFNAPVAMSGGSVISGDSSKVSTLTEVAQDKEPWWPRTLRECAVGAVGVVLGVVATTTLSRLLPPQPEPRLQTTSTVAGCPVQAGSEAEQKRVASPVPVLGQSAGSAPAPATPRP